MWVCRQRHAPANLPPGKTQYKLCRRLGVPQDRSGRVREISSPPCYDPRTVGPTRSNSLYRLSYPILRNVGNWFIKNILYEINALCSYRQLQLTVRRTSSNSSSTTVVKELPAGGAGILIRPPHLPEASNSYQNNVGQGLVGTEWLKTGHKVCAANSSNSTCTHAMLIT
jgi:hypothetical protein